MNLLQRIWWLCLLAVASSGAAPLWLHQSLCHQHAFCGAHAEPTSGNSANHSHAHCSHSHTIPSSDDSVPSKKSRPTSLVDGQAQHDCTACFLLSQLTGQASYWAVNTGHHLVAPLGCIAAQRLSTEHWNIHVPRGPPVC